MDNIQQMPQDALHLLSYFQQPSIRTEILSYFQQPSIRTEIRRAAGISIRTAPLDLVYLGCHLHCRFTWRRSSLLCRRQPTLLPLPSCRPIDCCSQIGWMHQESRDGWSQISWGWTPTRLNSCAWLGSRQQLAKIDTKTMTIVNTPSNLRLPPRISCVTFDSELGMDIHVNDITWSCFYQLTQLRSIRRSFSTDAAKTLVHSRISSRVEYCHSIFYGATNIFVRRLQSLLNAAARLISNRRKFDHITSVLRDQLHWLPSVSVSTSRLRSFIQCPPWSRSDIPQLHLQSIQEVGARAHLRSAHRGDLTIPVVSGPEASVSPDRLFGTHCPRTFQFRNCRWNVSNLCCYYN